MKAEPGVSKPIVRQERLTGGATASRAETLLVRMSFRVETETINVC